MSARRTRPRATTAQAAVEQAVELTVVARQAGVRIALARRYLAFGLFDPCAGTSEAPLFEPICASRLAKAERLRRDLGLNHAGAVLVCELLDHIGELEDRLAVLSDTATTRDKQLWQEPGRTRNRSPGPGRV